MGLGNAGGGGAGGGRDVKMGPGEVGKGVKDIRRRDVMGGIRGLFLFFHSSRCPISPIPNFPFSPFPLFPFLSLPLFHPAPIAQQSPLLLSLLSSLLDYQFSNTALLQFRIFPPFLFFESFVSAL